MLQSMGSQRVGHDLVAEQHQQIVDLLCFRYIAKWFSYIHTHTHIHTHIFILFQLNIHFNDFLIFQGIDSCNLFKCSFFSFLEFKLLQFFLIIDNILTNHLPETSIHVSLIIAITTNSWKRNNRLRGMNVSKTQSILLNGSPESSNLRAH